MNILIADDDPVTLKLLSTTVAAWGHRVYEAVDGERAWQTLTQTSMDIVVSDWKMPALDGLDLCRRIREQASSHYTYLILVSAQDSRDAIVHGLASGVDDYITKPIDLDAFHARIDIGCRIVQLERSLRAKLDLITANHYQTIRMFAQLMEVFDGDLGGHCRRTAQLAVELAQRHPDVREADLPIIETAALLHDIGMVGLPKHILSKRRTEMVAEERRLYQSHPEMGARIIEEIAIMKPAARLLSMHHEQYNGKGFPAGAAGDAIPLGAQLIAAASIYDNMVHKGGVAMDQMTDALQRFRGYQLAPALVDMVLAVNADRMLAQARQRHETRGLDQLEPGMVLAAPVHMFSGALIMATDTALDAHKIEKLNHYHAIGAIADKVLIHQPSARR